MSEGLLSAHDALDQADKTVRLLYDGCCDEVRAIRIDAVADTLRMARSRLDRIHNDNDGGRDVISALEDAGAQLGGLQIGCCVLGRSQLYAKALESLAKAQLGISRSFASNDHSHDQDS